MTTAWLDRLQRGKSLVAELDALQRDIAEYRDRAAAEIATALQHGGAVVNADAVRAVVKRPYEIIPINEREARLIQFKGIDAPIVGWVEKDTPAFRICRVTRLMNVVEALPDWVNTTLGWRAPDHQALIDSTREAVRVTSGDVESFRRKYGAHLANDLGNGSFKIKRGDAWIKLVAQLITDGIMPYMPSPVAPEHWDASAKSPIKMRDYQDPVIAEFLREGALTINHPAGAGKRFVGLFILAHFRGRVLIAIDSDAGREQWQDSLKDFPPHKEARVTVSTLQGIGKHLKDEWDLVIMDEAQRVPANNFSRLAFVQMKYRLGLTSTAWREDKRESLIFALCGRPAHISWSSLIRAGVLRRPSITVVVVKNDAAKTARVKSLVAQRKGQTLIYCDWIAQGQALANLLDVPFIHGETPKKLAALREADVAVVSRVADRAIDLPALRTVIEVAGQGKSREQLGQRVGRLLHGIENGEFYVLFTAEEFSKFRPRLFGIEAELAGEVDIALLDESGVTQRTSPKNGDATKPAKKFRGSTIAPQHHTLNFSSRDGLAAHPKNGDTPEPADEIARVLSLPAVAAKIAKAQTAANSRAAAHIPRLFRLCFSAEFSPVEIAEAFGQRGASTVARYRAACKALVSVGLFAEAKGRFTVSQAEINRLKALASAVK